METRHNARVILQKRPRNDAVPSNENFQYQKCPYPSEPLKSGEVLIKNLYLSVDPTLRFCMNDGAIPFYLKRWEIDETILGVAGIGVVTRTDSPLFQVGDFVTEYMKWPWQLYFIKEDKNLQKIDTNLTGNRITLSLSCFGVPGLTSLLGIQEKGHIVGGTGQTFVVSAAAGSCGSLAGQIARLEGCGKLVGICSSLEKCQFLSELGFDVAINYKTDKIKEKLKEACPNGVDRYFDNVGGEISDIVIEQMNFGGHVILCGQISQYDKAVGYPFPASEEIQTILNDRNITREPFLVLSYENGYEEGLKKLAKWFEEGKLIIKEEFEEGLENAAEAYLKMMRGVNIGKQLVHLADP